MALQPFVGPWPLFSVSWSYTQSVGLPGWGIKPSQSLYLHMQQHKHRINAHNKDILPRMWFEPTILAFKQAKTVHSLDRAGTVIGHQVIRNIMTKYLKYTLNKEPTICLLLPIWFEVLTVLTVKSTTFWDVPPYSPVEFCWWFGGTYCLHLQGQGVSHASSQEKAGGKSPKRRWTSIGQRGLASIFPVLPTIRS
jgi:hypothetical protein